MPRPYPDYQNYRLVRKTFKKFHSYAETGRKLGISRQRVFQIVCSRKKPPVYTKVCASCGKRFRSRIIYSSAYSIQRSVLSCCNSCFQTYRWRVDSDYRKQIKALMKRRYYIKSCLERKISQLIPPSPDPIETQQLVSICDQILD